MKLSNWNNYPVTESEIQNFSKPFYKIKNNSICRGTGLCYGDASLSNNVISTKFHDKILFFDSKNGILTCQSGVTLEKILNVIIPKKWFLPVSPGTKYITIGGALASDIHGKNHHKDGSFSNHVISFQLITHDNNEVFVKKEIT